MKKVVGIHFGHDPNIGIVDIDSNHIYHFQAERKARRKHRGCLDFDAIYDKLDISNDDVLFYVISIDIAIHPIMFKERSVAAKFFRKYFGKNFMDEINDINKSLFMYDHHRIGNAFRGKDVYIVRHHICHTSYTYFTSPFDSSIVFSYDGIGYYGEKALSCFCNGNKMSSIRDYSTFALGWIYESISDMIFNMMYDNKNKYGYWEGKTMALASFGEPIYLEAIRSNFYIPGDPFGSVNGLSRYRSRHGECRDGKMIDPQTYQVMSEIHEDVYKQRIEITEDNFFKYICDLACSWQSYFEDIMLECMTMLKEHFNSQNICIGGGCGLNGYINYRLQGVFQNVYIAPATDDGGLGLGAALYGKHVVMDMPKVDYGNVAYLGDEYDIDESIFAGKNVKVTKMDYADIYDVVSNKLMEQKIVGWYQGRSESGPRSLGNRSILCDPRDKNMKSLLNDRVKHREWFRPFAPAVLKELVGEYFYDVADEKYMLKIAKVKPNHINSFPAAVHIDNTARVQTVSKEDNLHFYNLIRAFYQKTGLPILLNTSFNDKNEPIVNSPEDALKTFLRTEIDLLVLKCYVVEKT